MANIPPDLPSGSFTGVNAVVYNGVSPDPAWSWSYAQATADYAASVGAQILRTWGSPVHSIYAGYMRTSDFLAQWDLLGPYCKSIGLRMYPLLLEPNYLSLDTTEASWLNTISAFVAHVEAQSWADYVIGYDLANEPQAFNNINAAQVGNIYAAVKAITSRPCTVSYLASSGSEATNFASNFASFLPYCDFVDMHIYYQPGATDFNTAVAAFPAKTFICGEHGIDTSQAAATRASRYQAVQAATAAFKAVLQWNIVDTFADPTISYGVLTAPGSVASNPWQAGQYRARSYSEPLLQYRKGGPSSLGAPTNLRTAGKKIMWDSPCSSNYAKDRLYKNGVKVFEDVFALYQDVDADAPGTVWQAARVNQSNVEFLGDAYTVPGTPSKAACGGASGLPVFGY